MCSTLASDLSLLDVIEAQKVVNNSVWQCPPLVSLSMPLLAKAKDCCLGLPCQSVVKVL